MSVTQHARKAAANEPAAKAAARGAGLLEEAFAQHQAELLGTLYYLVGNLEDARDALQEAFIKCWRHQAEVGEVAEPEGVDFPRGPERRAGHPRDGLAAQAAGAARGRKRRSPAAMTGRTEIVEHDERLTRLREALKQLRPEEQEVFLLRQNGELTYEEIAETLDVPTGTVKTRMRLALSRLREVLAEV